MGRRIGAVVLVLTACLGRVSSLGGNVGDGASPSQGGGGGGNSSASPQSLERGPGGIARLTRIEYTRSLQLLLGVDLKAEIEASIPSDNHTPFDNDYTKQETSKPLIEGLQAVAEKASEKVLADPALTAKLLGCAPQNQSDAPCFSTFVTQFGRRAFRRPLSAREVEAFGQLLTSPAAQNNFQRAVGLVLRSMLQSPDFLYRTELGDGTPAVNGRLALTPFELATRLSFTLWGEPPDDKLLDAAQNGGVSTAEGLRTQALRLLDDAKSMKQVERFHAQLWQYESMQVSGQIAGDLRRETDALVRRVIFDKRTSWLELFRSTETFANASLRKNYGMPESPNIDFEWVAYARDDQMGILSHGSILSNGISGQDTSPVFRGKFIRERLLCQPMPEPPMGVVAALPTSSESLCKPERFAQHSSQASCAGCHKLMDGIGLGLEAYNPVGTFRTTEPNKPMCAISGEGSIEGEGTFKGPKGLSELLLKNDKTLSRCMLRGLYSYLLGRGEFKDGDEERVEAMAQRFEATGQDFRALWLELVSDDSFRFRSVDEG